MNKECCYKCGYMLEDMQTILSIKRVDKFTGWLVFCNIYIDGNIIGSVGNDSTISCYVGIGKHELVIEPMVSEKLRNEGRINKEIVVNEFTKNIGVIIEVIYGPIVNIESISYN